MSKTIVVEGKTTTEAIDKGLKELKISKENAEIRVLEEKKKSFFNILDPHVVKVEITSKLEEVEKDKSDEHVSKKEYTNEEKKLVDNVIHTFLDSFMSKISQEIKYQVTYKDNYFFIKIVGEEATKLIGYRGEALNALQTIIINIVKNKTNISTPIIVDIEEYREKRRLSLENLAIKMENHVARTGKKVTLEPMSAYDRKVIHTKLQDSPTVKTYSIGQDRNRRVVITKK